MDFEPVPAADDEVVLAVWPADVIEQLTQGVVDEELEAADSSAAPPSSSDSGS